MFSSDTLHAKVIATKECAVIGSANASHRSHRMADEAVVLTDDAATVAAARDFIESLDGVVEVDKVFLQHAQREWEAGSSVPLPGVTEQASTDSFLPKPLGRVIIAHVEEYESTASEHEIERVHRRKLRSKAGPAAAYSLSWYRHEPTLIEGDVVLMIDESDNDGNSYLWPPGVVCSEPIRIPRSRDQYGYFLRYRTDWTEIGLSEATARLREAGIAQPRLHQSRAVRSRPLVEALLGLWAD